MYTYHNISYFLVFYFQFFFVRRRFCIRFVCVSYVCSHGNHHRSSIVHSLVRTCRIHIWSDHRNFMLDSEMQVRRICIVQYIYFSIFNGAFGWGETKGSNRGIWDKKSSNNKYIYFKYAQIQTAHTRAES